MDIDAETFEKWLTKTNDRYREQEIPHFARGMRAVGDFTKDFNCSLTSNSTRTKAIFAWFDARSTPEQRGMGAMFIGAFYFDSQFYPVTVPIILGQAVLRPMDCLKTMPPPLKEYITSDKNEMWRLAFCWADCCDYGYGYDDLLNMANLTARAKNFLMSANSELAGAITQLIIPRPNTKAILGLRMATEIFLKTVIIQETGATDEEMKNLFGHGLDKSAEKCFKLTKNPMFTEIAKNVSVFPKVFERYESSSWSLSQVRDGLLLAQFTAAATTRQYTQRNIRQKIASQS